MSLLAATLLWALAALSVLGADLLASSGVAAGVAYVLLALIGSRSQNTCPPFACALLITLLIAIGGYLSLLGDTSNAELIVTYRLLAIAAVWVTAALAARRRSAEQDQGYAGDLLRTLAATTPDMVFAKNRNGNLLLANPAVCRAVGKPAEQLIGRDESQWLANPEEAAVIKANDRRIMEAGNTEVVEEWVTTPDDKRLFRITKTGLRSRAGQVIGLVGIGRDVTSERQAEEANQRLAAIIRSTDDAIIGKTLDGIVTSWNRGAEKLYGYTAAEMVGQRIARLVPPDRPGEIPGILARLRRGELVDHFETVRVCKDGSLRDISLSISPISDSRGQTIGASTIARDITKRKQAERTLLELDRRKNEFLATLGHELRNPLAALASAFELMGLAQDPATLAQSRAMIERQVVQLTRLVDDLLDVSRITQGRLLLQKRPTMLAEVVRSAVEDTKTLVERARHALSVTLPEDPIVLDADPLRLEQVLANLLTNAAKYTPPGGHIELLVEPNGSGVRLSVRDNGLGIPPDKLETVFEMFGQIDRSLETGYQGLGIGLSLAKSLIEMHGGRIEAKSEGLDKGSEFNVWLPLACDTKESTQGKQGDATHPRSASRHRVLLVDDNRDVVSSFSALVGMLGHETRIAHDGLEAVAVAAVFRPHLVLLDIGLPKLNGYDVARQIRAQPWGKEMVLVAVTGWGQENDRKEARRAGFDHHFTKPIKLEALQALLDGVEAR